MCRSVFSARSRTPKSEIRKYLNPKSAPTPYAWIKSRRIGLTSTLGPNWNTNIEVVVASAKLSRIRRLNNKVRLNFKGKVFIESLIECVWGVATRITQNTCSVNLHVNVAMRVAVTPNVNVVVFDYSI